jgi:hypothetical protein
MCPSTRTSRSSPRHSPCPAGTAIAVEFDEAVEGRAELTVLKESAWLFFADMAPGWKFEHSAQIILVQADDGSVQVFDVGWWPLIDGQVRVAIDSCYSGNHIGRFATHMPLDPDASEVRHVHVMTATTAIEQSSGSAVPGTTFTEDLYEYIEELGGVDFTGMFDCVTDRAWTQTLQQQSWWNNGA